MQSETLLPCPFCGRQAEIERYGDFRQSTVYRCTFCGCKLETSEERDYGRDWNTRANTGGTADG
jgi:Lar family restriction alleviation protein